MPLQGDAAQAARAILAKIGAKQAVINYRKGDCVFAQGDSADVVYYLHDGRVKLSVVSELGKEAVVAILDQGDFFGEGCLVGQTRRVSTVTALTDCVIGRLSKVTTVAAIHNDPAFADLFVGYVLTRTIRVEADLVDQLFNSSEKRLARLLLLLANFGKDEQPERILAKISQETLADMIGTTRSRVSGFMNKFRRLGFIDYNGSIIVHTSLLNAVLQEHPEIAGD
jgi:CRP/FNR family cyclic AMP-dependent transcriptional regulator